MLDITCGVPQGSILGPLLFIAYINNLAAHVKHCKVALYADDTAVYYASDDKAELQHVLNRELANLSEWFACNKLTLNVSKTKYMVVGTHSRLKNRPSLAAASGCPAWTDSLGSAY